MNYQVAVALYSEEEIKNDVIIWWAVKSDEEKYKIMAAYLIKQKEG